MFPSEQPRTCGRCGHDRGDHGPGGCRECRREGRDCGGYVEE